MHWISNLSFVYVCLGRITYRVILWGLWAECSRIYPLIYTWVGGRVYSKLPLVLQYPKTVLLSRQHLQGSLLPRTPSPRCISASRQQSCRLLPSFLCQSLAAHRFKLLSCKPLTSPSTQLLFWMNIQSRQITILSNQVPVSSFLHMPSITRICYQ